MKKLLTLTLTLILAWSLNANAALPEEFKDFHDDLDTYVHNAALLSGYLLIVTGKDKQVSAREDDPANVFGSIEKMEECLKQIAQTHSLLILHSNKEYRKTVPRLCGEVNVNADSHLSIYVKRKSVDYCYNLGLTPKVMDANEDILKDGQSFCHNRKQYKDGDTCSIMLKTAYSEAQSFWTKYADLINIMLTTIK